MAQKQQKSWQSIAEEAQKYRDATLDKIQPAVKAIPPSTPKNAFDFLRSSLSSQEINITESPAEKLLEHLRTGRWSAVSVTNAFLRRAKLTQKLVCILHTLIC